MKLWQRYLVCQVASIWGFFLGALWVVYVVIDFSTRGLGVSKEIAKYYLANFSIYFDFFVSLSFLLALLKVLLDLNGHGELTALQMGGISKKKLILPLFFLAFLSALFSWSNGEWIAPSAHELVDQFWTKHDRKKKALDAHLHCLVLADGSELLYQRYHTLEKRLEDLFWLRCKREIWHLEHLDLETRIGRGVEKLRREESGWRREEAFPERLMAEMQWRDLSLGRFIPFANRSISSLFHQIQSRLPDRFLAKAHFFYQLARPLMGFLILVVLAPVVMRFERGRSLFLIVIGALGLFFGFVTVLDGMLLIGETNLLAPAVAIWSPFVFVFLLSFPRFVRM